MRKLFLFIIAFIAVQASAQTEAEMKAWMTYMTPGSHHSMLAKSAGEWKADMKMWMAPGTEPITSVATMKNEMILGGRYLQSVHKGEFMGMPFEGISTTAYDNATKKFVSTWVDNMGTGIMTMEGVWDEKTRSIEFKGSCTDPMTGKPMAMREIWKIIDDKTQYMEMYMTHEGKETKSMEVRLSR